MEEKRMALFFSVGKDTMAEMTKIMAGYGIEAVLVSKDQYGLPLENIISGRKIIGIMPYNGPDFRESMMILHNLQGSQLNNVLSAAGASRYRPDLVAITTETNIKWSPLNLYTNLTQERDALRRARIRNGADEG